MLSQKLWQQNIDLAFQCLNHPFLRRLSDGSLSLDVFRRYVAQDAFFLRAFTTAYAVAAAKSTDNFEHVRLFHQLMGGVLDELKLHGEYAARLGVDLHSVTPYPVTLAYTDFLLRTAWHEPVDHTIAAMAPCMRLYAFLGRGIADRHVPLLADHAYRRWIETYSSGEFEQLARGLESLLDQVGRDTPAVHNAYNYAMKCEYDFFDAPMSATA
jgi:thiaminase (transcriptional activator TenA)